MMLMFHLGLVSCPVKTGKKEQDLIVNNISKDLVFNYCQ